MNSTTVMTNPSGHRIKDRNKSTISGFYLTFLQGLAFKIISSILFEERRDALRKILCPTTELCGSQWLSAFLF